jgi:putative chitobiose transport system substrate-binding protein
MRLAVLRGKTSLGKSYNNRVITLFTKLSIKLSTKLFTTNVLPVFLRVGLIIWLLASVGLAQTRSQTLWTIGLSPTFTDTMNTILADYQAAFDVTVQWRDFSGDALYFELQNALASGNAPDVVNLNVPLLLEFVERGDLQPLELPALAGYFPNMVDAFRVSGDAYGLPWYIAPPLLMMNRELFLEAGLDPDVPPTTRAELFAAARHIKDATGVDGFMPNVGAQRMLYRFAEAGLPILSDDGFTALFDSPVHIELLTEYVDLFQAGYFSEDALLRGYVGALERYQNGQLAMLISGPQLLTRVREASPDIYAQTSLAPYPETGDTSAIHAPLMGLAIPKGVPQAPAVQLARFIAGADAQLTLARATPVYPTTLTAAEDAFFNAEGDDLETQARRLQVSQLPLARDLTLDVPNPQDLYEVFMENMEAAFYGQKNPEQALKDAALFWNSRL